MPSNVLPLPFVALLVYGAIQVLKSIVPGMDRWPNNVTRAAGYALTYAAIVVNARVGAPLHWADLWGLLPTAAAVYGGSALLYHVQDTGTPLPATAPQPPPAATEPAERAPARAPSASEAAWTSTTVSYGPPASAEAPVGLSVPGLTFPGANASPPSSVPVSESADPAPVGPSVSVPAEPQAP